MQQEGLVEMQEEQEYEELEKMGLPTDDGEAARGKDGRVLRLNSLCCFFFC